LITLLLNSRFTASATLNVVGTDAAEMKFTGRYLPYRRFMSDLNGF